MRHTTLLVGAALTFAACEGNAGKLERLKVAEASACLPVLRADSAEAANALVVAKVRSGSTTLEEADSNIAAAKRHLAELKNQMDHPAETATKARDLAAQRTACDLAHRDVNLFIGGR